MNDSAPRKGGLALGISTMFLSLNVTFVATFAVLIFKYATTALRASAFYFLQPADIFFTRRAAEVDRLLHLSIGSDAGAERGNGVRNRFFVEGNGVRYRCFVVFGGTAPSTVFL